MFSASAFHTAIRRGFFYMVPIWMWFGCISYTVGDVKKLITAAFAFTASGTIVIAILLIPTEPELALMSCSGLLVVYGFLTSGVRDGIRLITPMFCATGVMQVWSLIARLNHMYGDDAV